MCRTSLLSRECVHDTVQFMIELGASRLERAVELDARHKRMSMTQFV